ncbi:hypothetical protein [Kitasatospora cinereorecta]|uniref:Uncharacterized protein n=1 Tax=Kitasatospora cinereorecta TaxID=285560 RepID=A0ABW0VFM9_9ACTN
MPASPSALRLLCVGLGDRARALPAGVRRLLVVAVVLISATLAVVLGADPATVTWALALPSDAVKLADLAVGEKPGRRRSGRPALQGR